MTAADGGMEALCTIGYQGATPEAFVRTLVEEGVGMLVDVREAPWSRRPAFTRAALAERLAAAGIAYRHERALGAPRPLRDRVRAGGDRAAFEAAYLAHLAAQDDTLDRLARELTGRVALMCYERDVRECHRRLVADALQRRTGLTPRHLQPGRDHLDPQARLALD